MTLIDLVPGFVVGMTSYLVGLAIGYHLGKRWGNKP